ncbi:ribokinase [Oceanithermus desulfurans]|uniref:Ribokinase n=2 Tax=Oceanithermus desulfurans TaxID=227924 RepID=A0A511RLV5_9DEIN|nr:ribokinase [Oceanithermus desulfurans]MBB6030791.1 ribokinase [Oceanithermus desulfurans]GEM90638.1 ribokinase [Oceanithermus desulfurans NBRC 100063]
MEPGSVLVVGSLNMDLVVAVERHPKPGETVIGGDLQRFPGGKGANQAVAAARLGARVRMVGRVGADAYGAELKRGLEAEGIETAEVAEIEAPTGVALISVSADGQNAIVVSPGANARLRPEDLNPERFAEAAVVVLQLETPLETVRRAAELGRAAGARVLLNAAPAQELPAELLAAVDVLVVNEFEAARVAGAPEPETPEEALALARELARRVPLAVVTLGARGLVWAGTEGEGALPAFKVKPVDTTAAGDAFVGGLAAALAAGEPLEAALRFASAAGALAATRPGAQPSLPTADEVAGLLSRRAG